MCSHSSEQKGTTHLWLSHLILCTEVSIITIVSFQSWFFTSAEGGRYVTTSVCLSVSKQNNLKSYEQIFMKFSRNIDMQAIWHTWWYLFFF